MKRILRLHLGLSLLILVASVVITFIAIDSGVAYFWDSFTHTRSFPAFSEFVFDNYFWAEYLAVPILLIGIVVMVKASERFMLHYTIAIYFLTVALLASTSVALGLPLYRAAQIMASMRVEEAPADEPMRSIPDPNPSPILTEVRIPHLEFNDATPHEAIEASRKAWKEAGGEKPWPVVEVYKARSQFDPARFTCEMHNVSALDALRIVAELSMCRIQLREDGVILHDIWPGDFLTTVLPMGPETFQVLGLIEEEDESAILAALVKRGLDDATLKVHLDGDVDMLVLSGSPEAVGRAEAIIGLSMDGYEITKGKQGT